MPRVVLSLVCLGLVLLFVWLIVQWIFLPTVHFAYLPVVDYDVLAAPPVRFVREDVQAFAGVTPHRAAVELGDLQTSDAMPTLTRRLEACQTAGKDTLVLYVAGHGIAEDGTAYLLCSDFLRRDAPGRYPLGDLLTELEAFPADLKLLILDAGRLPYDARLGVLVNEFPRLLEDALKQHQDPRLWVLSANCVLETSHVSSPARQSPFGYYLAEAIRGGADRDGDAQVDLAELADYVRAGVSQWVQRESGGRDHQTPQLLQAGAGSVSTPPPLTLTPVPRQLSQAEKALARDTEGQPEARRRPKRSRSTASRGPVPPRRRRLPRRRRRPRNKRASPPCRPLHRNCKKRGGCWRSLGRADAFQARTDSGTWLPADYAPHLWREYQETLLGYEQRLWAGQAFQAKEIAASLQKEVLPLAAVLRDAAVPAGVDRGTVLGRLAEARQQFVASEAKASYEQPLPGIEILREAIQLGNELTLDAAYLVRWHAAASASSPQSLTVYQPLRQLLDQGLPALRKLLDEFLTADSISAPGRADRQAKLDDLRRLLDQLRQLRDQIQRDGIQREAQQLASEVSAGGQAKGVADRIDGFLATPLLPAPLRQALLEARGRLDSSFGPPDLGSVASPPPAVPGWRRERLQEQGQLEIRLVAWADPEAAAGLEARFAAVKQADEQRATGGDDGPWWQAWRQLGADLSAFYRDLPARIRQSGQSPDSEAARRATRLLRLVDAAMRTASNWRPSPLPCRACRGLWKRRRP